MPRRPKTLPNYEVGVRVEHKGRGKKPIWQVRGGHQMRATVEQDIRFFECTQCGIQGRFLSNRRSTKQDMHFLIGDRWCDVLVHCSKVPLIEEGVGKSALSRLLSESTKFNG